MNFAPGGGRGRRHRHLKPLKIPSKDQIRYSFLLELFFGVGAFHDPRQTMKSKGRMTLQKRMNFLKNSKRPLTPLPPSFSENHIADFATKLRQKCICSLWRDCCVLYDPISHEMHVVQQFNMVIG